MQRLSLAVHSGHGQPARPWVREAQPLGLSRAQPPASRPAHGEGERAPARCLLLPARQDSPGPSTRVGGSDCPGAKKTPLRKVLAPDNEPLLLLSALLSHTKPRLGGGQTLSPPIHNWPAPSVPALRPGPPQVHAWSGLSLCASPGARPCALNSLPPTDHACCCCCLLCRPPRRWAFLDCF